MNCQTQVPATLRETEKKTMPTRLRQYLPTLTIVVLLAGLMLGLLLQGRMYTSRPLDNNGLLHELPSLPRFSGLLNIWQPAVSTTLVESNAINFQALTKNIGPKLGRPMYVVGDLSRPSDSN